MAARLLDFGLGHIDLWRSEEMQLVQVRAPCSNSLHSAAIGDWDARASCRCGDGLPISLARSS